MTTTFHCDKLCSNACCQWLNMWLGYVAANEKRWGMKGCECPSCAAYHACLDPAKLAKLMAIALRARMPREWHIYGAGGDLGLGVCIEMENDFIDARTTLAQARAKLLAIMQTPADESSREACEQIVRGKP